jgi:hypothetical protein
MNGTFSFGEMNEQLFSFSSGLLFRLQSCLCGITFFWLFVSRTNVLCAWREEWGRMLNAMWIMERMLKQRPAKIMQKSKKREFKRLGGMFLGGK